MNIVPRKIPDDCCWSFAESVYDNFNDFYSDLVAYNADLHEEQIQDSQISDNSKVKLSFYGIVEGHEEYQGLEIEIASSNEKPLMFLEFLFLANNVLYKHLSEAGHHYYEGLYLVAEINGTPTYELIQGS